jgi:L-threonylcarbamoyladenylate synthase
VKTRILTATLENVKEVAEVVKKGGLVVYPTETVYGLGCDPFNVSAVKRLIETKGARDKPLPILAHSVHDVERIAELTKKGEELARKFWPGPLTLILPRRVLPDIVTLGSATVGVRIPKNGVALKLLEYSGGLLVGTSANKTGALPSLTALEAYAQLKDEVDVVLDGGAVEFGVSSTVLDLTSNDPKIIREGPLTVKETRT